MCNRQGIDWKSKCKEELQDDLLQCEKALNSNYFDAAQRSIETQIARRINLALERFEEGRWGICEMCDKPIETKRLIARPCVEYCIDCQARLERQSKFRASCHVLASRIT
ncbi:MAG: RNA polymerase-binding transcription factor DksA [Anaerolineales bacterium]|nr:RNA polymerase-binding transcription factor DksA [Anaerolineales bacterium]